MVGKGSSSKMVSGLEEQNPDHSQKETFPVRTEETCRNERQWSTRSLTCYCPVDLIWHLHRRAFGGSYLTSAGTFFSQSDVRHAISSLRVVFVVFPLLPTPACPLKRISRQAFLGSLLQQLQRWSCYDESRKPQSYWEEEKRGKSRAAPPGLWIAGCVPRAGPL